MLCVLSIVRYITSEWLNSSEKINPLPGYEPAKQMLFASVFPVDSSELDNLFTSMEKLW